MTRGKLDNDVSFLKDEQFKALIPPDYCYISFSVVKKDEDTNIRENKILVFVVDGNADIKSFSIAVDDAFFNACNAYHDLLPYSKVGNMHSKYLWRLPDGNYKVTSTRQKPPGAVFINTSEDFFEAKQKLSSQLSETLIAPISNFIANKQNWIISPDGELNNIPFETLTFNGKLVIESKNVCYVPSLAVLKLMKEVGDKNSLIKDRKELFAMGNADYGNFSKSEVKRGHNELKISPDKYVDLSQIKWINLPGTSKELNQVSELFSANKQEIITGAEASERNLKQQDKSGNLGQYKFILFATHGLFLPEKPELSSIVLSQNITDEEYDGYVTVGELLGYNLNSDLVYLSACESGLGDYRAGEGIIGLPYALTIAGNKDTVMSLWEVNDEATAEFSSAFFKKLSRGKTEIQALNETKREFLSSANEKLKNPSVWAAFLLYGI